MRIPRRTELSRDRWMVSYLDVMTILLIFFVAAAAHSKNIAAQPAPVEKHSPLLETQAKLERLNLETKLEQRGLVITLPQAVLFSSGEDAINDSARPVVGQIAGVLRDIPNKVSLVGHADASPVHSRRFKNNWELAAARGLRLLELLSSEYSIDESRLSVASYSSFDPKAANDTADGRATNRRVEIIILDR